MQVTTKETLPWVKRFLNRQTDIRSPENIAILQLIIEEIPNVWKNVIDILNLESSKWLPEAVSAILKKAIEMREEIFVNSPPRSEADYKGRFHLIF